MTTTQTPNTTRRIAISADTFNDKGYATMIDGIAFRNNLTNHALGFDANEAFLIADATIITSHKQVETRQIIEISEGDEIEIEGYGTFRVGKFSERHYDVAMTRVA